MATGPQGDATVAPRFDRSVIDSLVDMIGGSTVRGFFGEFAEQAAVQRQSIADAMAAGDREAVYRDAHNLVSISGNLGIKRLSRLADVLQNAVRDERELAASCQALLEELDAVLGDLPVFLDEAIAA